MDSVDDTAEAVGCPIRKSTDQCLLAAPHGLSQRAASFIASQCQGIHQMPFRRLISSQHSPNATRRSKPAHRRSSETHSDRTCPSRTDPETRTEPTFPVEFSGHDETSSLSKIQAASMPLSGSMAAFGRLILFTHVNTQSRIGARMTANTNRFASRDSPGAGHPAPEADLMRRDAETAARRCAA